MTRTWRLDLPLTKPLSLNSRQHWAQKARDVRQLRADACLLARAAKIPPLGRMEVELHYSPRNKGRRDEINLTPTTKAIEDGIVDAGVTPDDTAEFVVPTMPIIDPPNGKAGRLYVLVREVLPECPTCRGNEVVTRCTSNRCAHTDDAEYPCPDCQESDR